MTENISSAVGALPTSLPEVLPVLPLVGALLLPWARLPLNIYEPRDKALIEGALGQGRLVGMIQPTICEESALCSPLYQIGCVGRITSFTETDDGRYLINLYGVCRFAVAEELPQVNGYRRVRPEWQRFWGDICSNEEPSFDRGRLMDVLRHYFKAQGIEADWSMVQNAAGNALVSSLAMICAFEPNEKQALLEAANNEMRANLLIALLEMACLPQHEIEGAKH